MPNTNNFFRKSAGLAAFAAASLGVAAAHPGHGMEPGAAAGVAHFFSGLDHLSATIAAGIVGAALARNWRGAVLWFAGFAVLMGLYHQAAFFHTFKVNGFDLGFMAAAMGTLAATFGAAKLVMRRAASEGSAP